MFISITTLASHKFSYQFHIYGNATYQYVKWALSLQNVFPTQKWKNKYKKKIHNATQYLKYFNRKNRQKICIFRNAPNRDRNSEKYISPTPSPSQWSTASQIKNDTHFARKHSLLFVTHIENSRKLWIRHARRMMQWSRKKPAKYFTCHVTCILYLFFRFVLAALRFTLC